MRQLSVLLVFVTGLLTCSAQEWILTVPERAMFSVAANPLNTATAVAGQYSRMYIQTTDGGATWQEMSVGEVGGTSQISTLLFHPRDTTVLFAGGVGFSGLERSTDGGFTWEKVLQDPLASRFEVSSNGSIAFHPGRPDTMYVIRSTPGIVYRSMNGGENWDSLGTIPGLSPTARMRAIAVCPDPDSTNIILVTGRPGYLYRSTDGGRTFTQSSFLGALHPDTEGTQIRWSPTVKGRVYITVSYSLVQNIPNAGLHVSDDYGHTWNPLRFVDTALQALEVFPTKNGDEIFVGGGQNVLSAPQLKGDSIVYRSVDGGRTWQNLSSVAWGSNELGEESANIWGFAVTTINGKSEVLMATEVGVYRSDAVTSVAVFGSNTSQLPLQLSGSTLVADCSECSTDALVVVADILGREQQRLQLPKHGRHRVDLTSLARGTYVARVLCGETSGSILFSR